MISRFIVSREFLYLYAMPGPREMRTYIQGAEAKSTHFEFSRKNVIFEGIRDVGHLN